MCVSIRVSNAKRQPHAGPCAMLHAACCAARSSEYRYRHLALLDGFRAPMQYANSVRPAHTHVLMCAKRQEHKSTAVRPIPCTRLGLQIPFPLPDPRPPCPFSLPLSHQKHGFQPHLRGRPCAIPSGYRVRSATPARTTELYGVRAIGARMPRRLQSRPNCLCIVLFSHPHNAHKASPSQTRSVISSPYLSHTHTHPTTLPPPPHHLPLLYLSSTSSLSSRHLWFISSAQVSPVVFEVIRLSCCGLHVTFSISVPLFLPLCPFLPEGHLFYLCATFLPLCHLFCLCATSLPLPPASCSPAR